MTMELPAPGGTVPSQRIHLTRVPDASGTTVTLADAAEKYGVSRSTLKRRLADGEIQGAHKLPGPRGDEWHLPVAALEALGYRPGQELDGSATDHEPAQDQDDSGQSLFVLVDLVTDLTRDLRQERETRRLELMAANEEHFKTVRDRENTLIDLTRTEERLHVALSQKDELEARLQSETAERERLRVESELLGQRVGDLTSQLQTQSGSWWRRNRRMAKPPLSKPE